MKCNVCNAELSEGQAFCAYCGTKIESTSPSEAATEQATQTSQTSQIPPVVIPQQAVSAVQNPQVSDDTAKNAKTGLIFGILAMAINCLGLIFGIIGLVNSIKGLRSATGKGMAIPGLILSIIGMVTSIFSVLYIFVFMIYMMNLEFSYLTSVLSHLTF